MGLGLIVGLTMYLSPDITQRRVTPVTYSENNVETVMASESRDVKSTRTTIPFVKDNNFDYAYLTQWLGDYARVGGWILFILVVIVVVAATSNGANLTDGLDGLCAGTSAIICVARPSWPISEATSSTPPTSTSCTYPSRQSWLCSCRPSSAP